MNFEGLMDGILSVNFDHSAAVKKLLCFAASDLIHFKTLQRKTHSIDKTYEWSLK